MHTNLILLFKSALNSSTLMINFLKAKILTITLYIGQSSLMPPDPCIIDRCMHYLTQGSGGMRLRPVFLYALLHSYMVHPIL